MHNIDDRLLCKWTVLPRRRPRVMASVGTPLGERWLIIKLKDHWQVRVSNPVQLGQKMVASSSKVLRVVPTARRRSAAGDGVLVRARTESTLGINTVQQSYKSLDQCRIPFGYDVPPVIYFFTRRENISQESRRTPGYVLY